MKHDAHKQYIKHCYRLAKANNQKSEKHPFLISKCLCFFLPKGETHMTNIFTSFILKFWALMRMCVLSPYPLLEQNKAFTRR